MASDGATLQESLPPPSSLSPSSRPVDRTPIRRPRLATLSRGRSPSEGHVTAVGGERADGESERGESGMAGVYGSRNARACSGLTSAVQRACNSVSRRLLSQERTRAGLQLASAPGTSWSLGCQQRAAKQDPANAGALLALRGDRLIN